MTPLRQRMVDDMQLRNLAPGTQKNYIAHVAGFAKYFGKSPDELDIEAVRQYQLYLLQQRKLSPESVNQYVSAVKFLYLTTLEMPWTDEYFPHVRRPLKLPVVLSQEEVLAFFDHIPSLKYRAALMVCYGAGLRISEAVALKVSDIDSQRGLIRIERSPGRPLAGIRRRMDPCFAATRRPGRSHPGGKVRLAPGPRRAIHQRGLHAHCASELLFAEYHGPQAARRHDIRGHGKDRELETGSH